MTVPQQSLDGIRVWMNQQFKSAGTKLRKEHHGYCDEDEAEGLPAG